MHDAFRGHGGGGRLGYVLSGKRSRTCRLFRSSRDGIGVGQTLLEGG